MLEARAVKEALVFDHYYDVNEFAKELFVTPSTVRQWHRRGCLPTAVKIGNMLFIPVGTPYPVRTRKSDRYMTQG